MVPAVLLLVLNCGSATVKFELFEKRGACLESLRSGTVEPMGRYREAIASILVDLPRKPDAVAHRVVHGGDRFAGPVRIDDAVRTEIRKLIPLAPLHNPPALEGIDAIYALGLPSVATFDTAFHSTIPEVARRYALSEFHRFGFHGLSHQYVTEQYAELADSPEPTIITLHLGNGCSATAVRKGRSVDTSMGFTPLEGLIMGTRAGDLDPGIVTHLWRSGWSLERVERLLHHESGLRAIAGTNDMRELLRRTDDAARMAVEMFCYRVRKYVGAYLAVLEGAEAIVFTGGIGENAAEIRTRVCSGFNWAGLRLAGRLEGRISTPDSTLHAWVIRTDEERLIGREAANLLGG